MKKADRQQVFDKYGGKCAYCGCELQKGWHVDHIEPVVRQQKWDKAKRAWVAIGFERPENDCMANYNPACASCNVQKSSQSIEAFRAQIAYFITSLNKYHPIYRFAKRYGLLQETGNPVVFYYETLDD